MSNCNCTQNDCCIGTAPVISTPEIPIDENVDIGDIKVVTEEDPVEGQGQFDRYMRAVGNQLEIQYKKGRIKGAELSATFNELIPPMMDEANKFVIAEYQTRAQVEKIKIELGIALRESELKLKLLAAQVADTRMATELKRQQVLLAQAETSLKCTQQSELVLNGVSKRALEAAQAETAREQVNLYKQQAKSFENKDANDTFKTLMNGYAVVVSEAGEPVAINVGVSGIDDTADLMRGKVGL